MMVSVGLSPSLNLLTMLLDSLNVMCLGHCVGSSVFASLFFFNVVQRFTTVDTAT